MENNETSKKHKIFGLFSAIRGYNIALLIIAQYLVAVFVFAVDQSIKDVWLDCHLHLVVLATVCVVSAGYIINDFYDLSIDLINKPVKTHIGNWVSKKTKLQVYFALNLIAFGVSFIVSWKAACFFSVYIFGIWLYSHKLQSCPIVRVLSVSILDVLPFFVVFVYYNHISNIILMHGGFLFGLILTKEIVKDFRRVRGAILNNKETLVTKYGARKIKTCAYVVMAVMMFPIYFLLYFPEIGYMKYYFYLYMVWMFPFGFFLLKAKRERHYLLLHNMLKIILVIGVFSLMLIDTSVLLIRVLNQVRL